MLILGASSQIGRLVGARIAASGGSAIAIRHIKPVDEEGGAISVVDADFDHGLPSLPLRPRQVISATELFRLPDLIGPLADVGMERLVCFSSTSIYSKIDSPNDYERERIRSVAAAEGAVIQACEKLGIGWTILRPTMIYGGGANRNVTRAARTILRFGCYPISPPADGLRAPIHADDLAAVSLRAVEADQARNTAFDLAGGETLTYREMIGRIFDALGKPRRFLPLPLLPLAADVLGGLTRRPEINAEVARRMNRDLVCDDGEARKHLDWNPHSFLPGGKADLFLD